MYWIRPYFDKLIDPMKSPAIQENLATSIVYFTPVVVPGMLQTEDYVRATFEAGGRYTVDRYRLVCKARMDRQSLLQRKNPPKFTFFVHQRTLRSLGDPVRMHEQLQLLLLSTNLPHSPERQTSTNA